MSFLQLSESKWDRPDVERSLVFIKLKKNKNISPSVNKATNIYKRYI